MNLFQNQWMLWSGYTQKGPGRQIETVSITRETKKPQGQCKEDQEGPGDPEYGPGDPEYGAGNH